MSGSEKTDGDALRSMTEGESMENALSDRDNLPRTEEDLARVPPEPEIAKPDPIAHPEAA